MKIVVPRLGEGADSGTVVNILVKEGDEIKKDQTLIELENEKAVAPIPSTAAGTVEKILVKLNDKISVGQAIISLKENGKTPAAASPEPAQPKPAQEKKAVPAQTFSVPASAAPAGDFQYRSPSGAPPPASPAIRQTARDLGIDLAHVRGSAGGGRVVLDDLKNYIKHLQTGPGQNEGEAAARQKEAGPSAAPSVDFSKWGKVSKEPLSQLRQAIAKKMTESWTTIPQVTQHDDVDITDLLALRKKYAPAYEAKNASLTLTVFILKALADNLKKHPKLNSSIDESTQELVIKEYVHIGIAVDTEQGLIVPVLRDVDKKSMLDIAKDLAALAEKTRQRKVSLDELKGGTFTVSNQGGIGGGYFSPIINKPEVAILGLGKGSERAVIVDKKVEIRTMLPVSLSYDHRLIDGGQAVRFLNDVLASIKNFNEKDLKI